MNIEIDLDKVAKKLEEAGVPADVHDQTLLSVVETLQINVGMRLEEALSDKELEEFQKLAEKEDPAAGIAWLAKRFPDYKQVVDDELDKIIADLKSTVESIKKGAKEAKDQ